MSRDLGGQRVILALAAASGLSLALAPEAEAGKRNPAPITFAGDTPDGQPGEGRAMQRASASASPVSPGGSGRRIEFRYPDQPDISYGPNGPRALGDEADPFAFSSSSAAISPEDAKRYSVSDAPRVEPPVVPGTRPEPRIDTAALGPVKAPKSRAIDYSAPRLGSPDFQPVAGASQVETGTASWYGPNFDGRPTASGEIFDQEALTGAHPTLPLPSLVEVTNLSNGRKLVIRINDRGPFIDNRVIDVSRKAAEILGFETAGTAEVSVRYIGPAGEAGVQTASRQSAAPSYRPEPARPASAPVQTRAPAPAPGDIGGLVVQVGAFSDIGNAEQVFASLSRDMDVRIQPVRVKGADYFRVVVGPYVDRAAASRAKGDLARRGYGDALIRWDE
jgi:rare lipoprotein A